MTTNEIKGAGLFAVGDSVSVNTRWGVCSGRVSYLQRSRCGTYMTYGVHLSTGNPGHTVEESWYKIEAA